MPGDSTTLPLSLSSRASRDVSQNSALLSDTPIEATLSDINRDFSEKKIAQHAEELKLPYVDILLHTFNSDLIRKIDFDEAETALALPFFAIGKKMQIAVADLEKPETKTYLARLRDQHFQLQINLASEVGILTKITELRGLVPRIAEHFENRDAGLDLQTYENEIHALENLEKEAHTLSAEATLNRIFIGAFRCGASDVHFEPTKKRFGVRFRIDGVLQSILTLEPKKGAEITDQLKYEAHLRLNVKNVPQDGRTNFLASGRTINVRVSTLPTEFGESLVCRLLDGDKKLLTPQELGFSEQNFALLEQALTFQNGLILLTGPTGSGKTTTLYAMLDRLNQPQNKVITLEDPIEYRIPGVVQSQVNEEESYTFANGLRSLLRQDPDIIMIGEIRDRETAEIAAQSAMTGHLVLSTLHTNSAIDTIPRLINIGLPPYLLTASLTLVVAQRLVRRVHTECAQKIALTYEESRLLAERVSVLKKINPALDVEVPNFFWQPVGCPACSHTGYSGQIALVEAFRFDAEFAALVMRGMSTAELLTHLRQKQKFLTLAEDGVLKVCRGVTTLTEIARVAEL